LASASNSPPLLMLDYEPMQNAESGEAPRRHLWNSGRVSVCPRSLSNYYQYISIASAVICLPCIFAMIPGDPHAQRPQVPFSVHNSFCCPEYRPQCLLYQCY
jgi:hypothetical protein